MTSNQVAYEVGMRNASENERHNQTQESINQQLADLEKQKLDFQDEWKRKDQQIQNDYNNAYIAYLNASQDWKQHYESQLAEIERQRADTETYYKGIISGVERDKATVQRYAAEETKRANLASEQLRDTQNWLHAKEIEYNNTAMLLQSSMNEAKLAQELLIAREQQSLEYAKLTSQQAAKAEEIKIDRERKDQEWVKIGVQAITGVISGALNLFRAVPEPVLPNRRK